jgi:hypothetical protein
MLIATQLAGFGAGAGGAAKPGFLGDLNAQNPALLTDLIFCGDASQSFAGTSDQTFTDLHTSANDFYRGDTGGSEASDPTINGTPGDDTSSEYLSFDGGDHLEVISQPAAADDWHEVNKTFSFAILVYFASGGSDQILVATGHVGGTDLVAWAGLNAGGTPKSGLTIYNDDTQVLTWGQGITGLSGLSTGAWHFMGMAYDEAAGTLLHRQDANDETLTGRGHSGASTGAADAPIHVGQDTTGGKYIRSGGRVAGVFIWDRALSSLELGDVYNAVKGRVGL